jgi:hypothetical protein
MTELPNRAGATLGTTIHRATIDSWISTALCGETTVEGAVPRLASRGHKHRHRTKCCFLKVGYIMTINSGHWRRL